MFTAIVNQILSILTIAAEVIAAVLLFTLITGKFSRVRSFFSRHAVWIAFAVSVVATMGSLTYSEIIGYDPCKLCWFQRIFMYPQVILFLVAMIRKDAGVWVSSLVFSSLGAITAGYHYLLQIGVAPALPCAAVGYSVSCSQRFVLQFGYITIPMMAFSAFLFVLVLMVLRAQRRV